MLDRNSVMLLKVNMTDEIVNQVIYMQNQYKTNRINTPCLFFDINNVNLNYRRPEDL